MAQHDAQCSEEETRVAPTNHGTVDARQFTSAEPAAGCIQNMHDVNHLTRTDPQISFCLDNVHDLVIGQFHVAEAVDGEAEMIID
jgi:hypothetical protein